MKTYISTFMYFCFLTAVVDFRMLNNMTFSFFTDIPNFVGHLMPKPFLLKNNRRTYISCFYFWGSNGVHVLSRSICPNVNVLVRTRLWHGVSIYD